MVLSFEDYINETFGAISMEFPPGHDKPLIQTPDIIKPLAISGPYGGSARVPRQWNNAPYLSGGFSGSGYGHFGEGPGDGDSPSDARDNEYRKHLKKSYDSMEDVKKTLVALNNELTKKRNELGRLTNFNDIDAMWTKERNDSEKLNKYEEDLAGESLDYHIENTIAPTLESDLDDGDPGEYESYIDDNADNRKTLKILGFSDDDMHKIFLINLPAVFDLAKWSSIPYIAELGKASLDILEDAHIELDDEYFNYSGRRGEYYDREIFEEFEITDALEYLTFKYIILAGLRSLDKMRKIWLEMRVIKQEILMLPSEIMRKIRIRQREIKEASLDRLGIDIPIWWHATSSKYIYQPN